MRLTKKILALALLLSPCFSAWTDDAEKADNVETKPREGQRTVVIAEADYDYDLNPQTASYTTEAQVLTGLFEGLFSYNPVNLEPEYALCTDVKLSRDQKRWTFTIRKGAKFSNGDPITAQTVKDSWLSLLSNPDASFASMLDCISGAAEYRTGKGSADGVRITVRGDNTLVVHLNQPASQFPRMLCHHAFAIVSKKENVYSGPFVVESIKDGCLNLVKNENYWDKDSVSIPGIKIIRSEDEDENTALFNTGDVDWVASSMDVEKIIDSDAVYYGPEFGTFFLFFKIKNKPWNKPEFRRALLEAIPYDKLRDGYISPATTLVYPLSGYPNIPGLDDYDIEDAVVLMNEARKKYGIPLDMQIPLVLALNESSYMQDFAELLRNAWKPLGVKLVVQTKDAMQYMSSIDTWNADLFYYSWIGDYADPMAFLELFRGGSTLNHSRYSNSVFDGLLNKAATTLDVSERYKILGQAEEKLLSDAVLIPIYHQVSLNIIDTDCIGGWSPNALDIHPFKYLFVKKKKINLPNMI